MDDVRPITHIRVHKNISLWQKKDNQIISLTDHPRLRALKYARKFDLSNFIELICQKYKWHELPNGFIHADLLNRKGNFIKAETWDENVEKVLLSRKYIIVN